MPAPISILIPTLNAGAELAATAATLIPAVADGFVAELIVSDGGSQDATLDVARDLGAVIVEGPAGRGAQIARGVEAARAPWVLIVHADTWLSPDWTQAAERHMAQHPTDAAYFRLRFRADGMAARIVAGGANLRSGILGLPYGDQGFLVRRDVLASIGVPEAPLMEDVILARRMRGRLRMLDATAQTSAARYERDGWARRAGRNLWTLARYMTGTAPETLAVRYNRNGG